MIKTEVIKTAVIYTRVSSEEQTLNFSLSSQKEACEKLAKIQGFTIIKEFSDEGISAKNIEGRQGLQDMLLYCSKKANKVSAVIVYNFSRLNRNTKDFLEVKFLLAKYGVMLISTTEPSGTDSPVEKAVQTILAAVNQMDNENKAVVVAINMKKRFMEGYPHSRPRIGYKSVEVNGRKEHAPDEEWFEIIKSLWLRIVKEQLTLGQATKELNSLHKRHFNQQWVSKIFSCKFYMGYNVSKKYGLEVKGKHIPMIDEDTFYIARQLITGRKPTEKERTHLREDFPIRGILKCSECNHSLTSAWSKGKLKKYPYYSCSTRGIHASMSFPKDKLEDQFLNLLKEIKLSPKMMVFIKTMLNQEYNARFGRLQFSSKTIEQDLKQIAETKQTLMEKHLKGLYTDEEFIEMKERLEIAYLDKKGLMSEKKLERIDIETILEFMTNYLTNLDRVFLDTSLEGKLAIGCSMFPEGIKVDRKGLRTPTLGRGYELTAQLLNQSTPKNFNFEHLFEDYQQIYQQLHRYIPHAYSGMQ